MYPGTVGGGIDDDDANDCPVCVCVCPGNIDDDDDDDEDDDVIGGGPIFGRPTKLLLVPIISDKISNELAIDFSDKRDAPESSDRSEPEPLRLRFASDDRNI